LTATSVGSQQITPVWRAANPRCSQPRYPVRTSAPTWSAAVISSECSRARPAWRLNSALSALKKKWERTKCTSWYEWQRSKAVVLFTKWAIVSDSRMGTDWSRKSLSACTLSQRSCPITMRSGYPRQRSGAWLENRTRQRRMFNALMPHPIPMAARPFLK